MSGGNLDSFFFDDDVEAQQFDEELEDEKLKERWRAASARYRKTDKWKKVKAKDNGKRNFALKCMRHVRSGLCFCGYSLEDCKDKPDHVYMTEKLKQLQGITS